VLASSVKQALTQALASSVKQALTSSVTQALALSVKQALTQALTPKRDANAGVEPQASASV